MDYDLIIVGMGPAGSATAIRATGIGLNVLGLDRAKFPRDKPCGGGIPILFEPTLKQYITNIDRKSGMIRVFNANGTCIQADSTGEGGLVLRKVFDTQLFEKAKSNPRATIWDGQRVRNIVFQKEMVKVEIEGKEGLKIVTGKAIIGADGINSIVAKATGLKKRWKANEVVLVYVNETELGKDRMDEFYGDRRDLIFHFGIKDTFGYGWIFPKTSHINVGFGGMEEETLDCRERFKQYVEYCQSLKILPEIDAKNTKAALVPMTGPLKQIYASRVMLVGDAASFVNPVSGEGIQYAIRSGHIAAEIIAGIIKDNDFRESRFKEYQTRCMDEFGKDLRKIRWLQKIGYRRIPKIIEIANKDKRMQDLLFDVLLKANVRKAFRFGMRYLRHLIFG